MEVLAAEKGRRKLANPDEATELRRLRRLHEIPQHKVAAEARLDQGWLSRAERGQVPMPRKRARAIRRAIRELVAKRAGN